MPADLGVEAGRGLVEEEQLGPADDAEGDVDAATLSARELADADLGLVGETDRGDGLVDVARPRVERGEVGEQLADGGGGRLACVLQHDAQARLPVQAAAMRIDTEHADVAARAIAVSLEDLDDGALAGAVGSEQGEGLASPDVERHAAQRLEPAPVGLPQVVDAHDGFAHEPSLAAPRAPRNGLLQRHPHASAARRGNVGVTAKLPGKTLTAPNHPPTSPRMTPVR